MRVAAAAAGVSLILASVSGESAAAPPRPDPWANHDRGIALANAVIVKCLRRDASKPPDGSVRCVRSAYLVCERQHGTMSQHDMNDCSYFSQHAWEARLTAAIARFMAAKTSESRLGAETEPTKQLLRKSQRQWTEWNQADCDMRSGPSRGGSIYPFEKAMCLSDHTAVRAMELESEIDWWLS